MTRKAFTRRTKTISVRAMKRLNALEAVDAPDESRPLTRGECQDGPRPCPWAGCRYHLYADIQKRGGLLLNFPGKEVHELPETCALDVAEEGGVTLQHVGSLMNMTRERVRQIEADAEDKIVTRLGWRLGAEEMTR